MDPRPLVRLDATVLQAPAWRGEVDGAVFGLLANGFPDSDTFLAAVSSWLECRFPGAAFRTVKKARPHDPLTDEQLHLLTEECDAVIAAYGH
jgi:hypothetical protein